jgi:hypothetical protein
MNDGVCLSERNLKAIEDNAKHQCMKLRLQQITCPDGLVILANNRRMPAECQTFRGCVTLE